MKRRGGHNKAELVGQVFGKLTVLKDTGRRKSRRPIWLCRCECGNECEILSKYLMNGDTKSCGCYSKGNAHNRSGYGSVSGSYFGHVKRNAARRGVPFHITPKDADDLYNEQCKKCALSGVDIRIVENYRDQGSSQTASIDRIDNSKGYIKDNIQWVHKTVNIMRNSLEVCDFVEWCRIISEVSSCNSTTTQSVQLSIE